MITSLVVFVALHGISPQSGEERERREALQRGALFLEEHLDDLFPKGETLPGLLAAVVGSALYSAGFQESFSGVDRDLLLRHGEIERTLPKVAALYCLSLDGDSDPSRWRVRQTALSTLIDSVQKTEVWPLRPEAQRQRRNSRHRPSNPRTGVNQGALGLRRSTDRQPTPDFGLLAAISVALRASERVGLGAARVKGEVPTSWSALAQWTRDAIRKDGSLARTSRRRPDRLGTSCGALILSLSRVGLIAEGGVDKRLLKRHSKIEEGLEGGIDWLESDKNFTVEDDWTSLLQGVVLSRLQWCLGDRGMSSSAAAWRQSVLSMQRDDGSFRCDGEIPCAPMDRDLASFYEKGQASTLMTTALAVLALSGVGKRADFRPNQSAFRSLVEAVESRSGSHPYELYEDLVVSDGYGSASAMLEELDHQREGIRVLARRGLESRAGWKLGLKDEPTVLVRASHAMWLDEDRLGWAKTLPWETWIGKGIHLLGRQERMGGVRELADACRQDAGADRGDILRALGSSRPSDREAAFALCRELGAPIANYDPLRGATENTEVIDAVEAWYETFKR